MLNVYYGKMPEAIFNTAVYFKNVYEDSWITDPFAKEKNQCQLQVCMFRV